MEWIAEVTVKHTLTLHHTSVGIAQNHARGGSIRGPHDNDQALPWIPELPHTLTT